MQLKTIFVRRVGFLELLTIFFSMFSPISTDDYKKKVLTVAENKLFNSLEGNMIPLPCFRLLLSQNDSEANSFC